MSKNIHNTAEAISSLYWGENVAVLLTLNTLMYIVMKEKEKGKKEKKVVTIITSAPKLYNQDTY